MQTLGLVPGCSYIYRTASDDIIVVRLPGDGLLGAIGRKNVWVVNRNDQAGIWRCAAEMMVKSPLWAVERGIVSQAQRELQCWEHPWMKELGSP